MTACSFTVRVFQVRLLVSGNTEGLSWLIEPALSNLGSLDTTLLDLFTFPYFGVITCLSLLILSPAKFSSLHNLRRS